MGKRVRRGGRSPSSSPAVLGRQVLLRRITASKLADSFDVEGVVHQLRSQYPDYARFKVQPLTLRVHEALDFLHTKANPRSSSLESTASDDDGAAAAAHDPTPSPARSCKRSDRSEQRLLRAEAEHLRQLKRHRNQNPNTSSSDDPSEGSISTSESEDAIFEAKVDPEFDLMKSMLRNNYGKQAKVVKPAGEEDIMEIEAVDEKKRITIGSTKKGKGRSEAPEKGRSEDEVIGRGGPRFEDIGGLNGVLEQLKLEVMAPLLNPQVPELLGIRPMTGVLLHGPPGCGKTKLAHAIANEAGVPFYKISAPEIVSGVSGASEENIRDLFKKASRTAPSIVFIDEIDVIASKRENLQREMERRIVTQLMTCMEESSQPLGSAEAGAKSEMLEKKRGHVLVIGATNRPDAVDQALRRPGRFDREIALGIPDENARFHILSVLARGLKLEGEFNLMKIARSTPGFVGADLAALVNKAGNLSMKRIMDGRRSEFSSGIKGENVDGWWRLPWTAEEMESIYITMSDFEEAIKMVQPSSRREGFSSIPSTKWEDVGGLNSLRKEFDRYIVQRIKNPEDYEAIGVSMEVGFLLYGPPGCGKTLIAKAVANESGANFIHIKGPELLNKYVGESELAVRTIFSRARMCSPCILFFDEVDALTTMRGREGGWVVERLLNQLLIELDGADQRKGVYVIGATNRLEVMDPAVLRPGRFGRLLYVPLPSAEERGLILRAVAREKPVAPDVDLDAFGRREACQNLTGADLAAVVNEAAMVALDERRISSQMGGSGIKLVIKTPHFEKALEKIKPSVNEKQRIYYETLSTSYRAA